VGFLELDNVSVAFSGVPALFDVSMSIDPGEAVSVLGANGAGKTTLLRTVMGRVVPTAGTIRLDGVDITRLSTRARVDRGIALCPENRLLFGSMSVQDNLLLGAYRAPPRQAAQRLDMMYQRFAWLRERRFAMAGGFSGGEQQLVAIGRTLMAAPRVLLLDEPSSGLSPVAIATIRAVLSDVAASGATLVLVEQNVALAIELTQRCYVLNRGTIEARGDTRALAQDPALADTYMLGGPRI
jgi:branched-chain amino acid transport system ATP-binding protein